VHARACSRIPAHLHDGSPLKLYSRLPRSPVTHSPAPLSLSLSLSPPLWSETHSPPGLASLSNAPSARRRRDLFAHTHTHTHIHTHRTECVNPTERRRKMSVPGGARGRCGNMSVCTAGRCVTLFISEERQERERERESGIPVKVERERLGGGLSGRRYTGAWWLTAQAPGPAPDTTCWSRISAIIAAREELYINRRETRPPNTLTTLRL